MGNRHHDHRYVAVLETRCRHNNRAGSILRALLGAGILLVALEEAVTDNQARLRGRKCHGASMPYSAASMSAMISSLSAPTMRACRSRALSFS